MARRCGCAGRVGDRAVGGGERGPGLDTGFPDRYVWHRYCQPSFRMAIANPGQAGERSVTHDARILVVDDESDIANLLGTVLREEGFTVRVVTDSRQAVEVFNSFRPDLVSLD